MPEEYLYRSREPVYSGAIAAEKLRQIEEFTEGIPPDVARFARHLANYVGFQGGPISPSGFLMCVWYALVDIPNGVNWMTEKPIDEALRGRTPETYVLFEASVPKLASIVFPKEFADAVEQEYECRREAARKRQASTPQERPVDPDAILTDITTINKARELIIEDARKRVLALDWPHFGLTDQEELGKIYDGFSRICLRDAPVKFPLTALLANDPGERALLNQIAVDHKQPLSDTVWLVMTAERIPAEEATFIRDWLWMSLSETIIRLKELPERSALEHLSTKGESFDRAAFRAQRYMERTGRSSV